MTIIDDLKKTINDLQEVINEKKDENNLEQYEYVIVRTYSSGVFAGYLISNENREITLKQARRIWYWAGAASLSQLAMEGTSKPEECKFPCPVDKIVLSLGSNDAEIISVTKKAKKSIEEVKEWKA
ncbi:hypothetical protein HGB13_03805 [bacterium]|nr:hypothetical protein [bacterium]